MSHFSKCSVVIPAFDEHIVDTIATLLANIVAQNEGVVVSPRQNVPSAVFGAPWMYEWAKIGEYMDRLKEWIVCGPESFIVATCLIKRLEAAAAIPPLTQRTAHRVFLTALLLAVKMMEDETLTNSDFAKVGCVSTKQLNLMEIHALRALKFNCSVSAEEFVECIHELTFAKQSLRDNHLKAAAAARARAKEAKEKRDRELAAAAAAAAAAKENKQQHTAQAPAARKMSIFSLRLKSRNNTPTSEPEPVVDATATATATADAVPDVVRRTASVDADGPSENGPSAFASNRRKSCTEAVDVKQCGIAVEITSSAVVYATNGKLRATPRMLLRQDSI